MSFDDSLSLVQRITSNALHHTSTALTKEYFYSYFVADLPYGLNSHRLVRQLRASDRIAMAYVDAWSIEPETEVDPDDPLFPNQGYLGAEGIDVASVWPGRKSIYPVAGTDGSGMQLIDIERGWIAHGDLPVSILPPAAGDVHSDVEVRRHGMKVLLVTSANDNRVGGIGIAPAARARTVSYFSASEPENRSLAIARAADLLAAGDVMLLEVMLNEDGFPPVEACQAEFDVIQAATNKGVVVIEAAGNGGIDLDAYEATGRRVLDPDSPEFLDSGAILVAAAHRDSLLPLVSTNFGKRVDCFAWGSGVFVSPAEPNFSETSAASAIVAGAALSVQGAAKAKPRGVLSPGELRALFRRPDLNKSSANGANIDLIGFMPRVSQIVADMK